MILEQSRLMKANRRAVGADTVFVTFGEGECGGSKDILCSYNVREIDSKEEFTT